MSNSPLLHPPISTTTWDYNYSKTLLPNGATLVMVGQPHLHRGTLSINIGTGSRYESVKSNGIAHFLEHMVFRGTDSFPTSLDLNLAIERLGGTFTASTTPDTTEFSVTLPEETMVEGARLLSELVISPRFNDIEIERKVIIEEIREELDEQDASIDIDFLSRMRLWPDHPLGQSVTGPVKNVEVFTTDDLKRWFGSTYTGGNSVICVTGAFEPAAIEDSVSKVFASLPAMSAPARPDSPALPTRSSTHHVHKPGSQTQLRVAFHSPGLCDKEYAAAEVLIRLIDDGMSTPLHQRVFDEKGLAYNVSADLETYHDVGALNFDASCAHDNVQSLLNEILLIASDLKNKPVPAEDLEKAGRRAFWSFKELLDDPESMNSWYGEQQLIRTPPSLEEEAEALAKITWEDVSKVADRIFSRSSLNVTTVGVQNDKQLARLQRSTESF